MGQLIPFPDHAPSPRPRLSAGDDRTWDALRLLPHSYRRIRTDLAAGIVKLEKLMAHIDRLIGHVPEGAVREALAAERRQLATTLDLLRAKTADLDRWLPRA